MAETTDQPTPRPAVPKAGMGNGPMIAAGAMFAGGVLAAGIGVGTMAFSGPEASAVAGEGTTKTQPATPTSPDEGSAGSEDPAGGDGSRDDSKEDAPGEVTVTLPDKDGNGIADALEEDAGQSADPNEGKPDEEVTEGGQAPAKKTYVYIIESGDTLAEISAETGVPLGTLVKTNDIENPNMIYAGAALLISPVA